jgi:P-type Ca2+ transporter type 2C
MADPAVTRSSAADAPAGDGAGLTAAEAAERLAAEGPNELFRAGPTPRWRVFIEQFRGAMVWLLVGACAISALLGEIADGIAIATILILNAIIGFLQESRAERAVLALRSMTAPRARVMRDGHTLVIPAAEVVRGDVLVLEGGDIVAADAHLIEAHALRITEAALTGESEPVRKKVGQLPADTPLAERTDSVFLGTSVATGTATAEVAATGMGTQLGRIAHMLGEAETPRTPLQARLEVVARTLLILCLGVVAVVFALGALRGQPWLELLLTSVSLAVAAVPEGLAAVVTIALAVGVQRMAARHVLVRRLPAVETLGAATVICTDKTGTLTTGVMTVREVWGPDHQLVLDAGAACCDADLGPDERAGTGDPTELAILLAAADRGIRRGDIERERPRVEVNPFDSERKRMSILRADGVLYVKGAFEVVHERCAETPAGAAEASSDMARRGLRVLAIATGKGPEEEGLRLLGLVGMADPPRSEAIDGIAAARGAGIRTIMITGDHPATARAIGRELGLLCDGRDPSEVIHARSTAEDKIRIVRELVKRGEIVAMTGDGVNDAPALREAHIGVAMGRTGTEVTREAADMVLTDDNYASIVAAIEEGRGIYENVRKTLVYLLAGNSAELLIMLGAALIGWPLPLLPLHLLWVNLVTDGLPALALVMDPAPRDALSHPPRPVNERMLGWPQWRGVLSLGLLEGVVVLATYGWVLRSDGVEAARTAAFTTLVFSELLRAMAARSPSQLFWEVGPFTNLKLLAVVAGSIVFQIGLLHIPASRELFGLVQVGPREIALALLLGLIPVSAAELAKLGVRAIRWLRRGAPAG